MIRNKKPKKLLDNEKNDIYNVKKVHFGGIQNTNAK